MFFVLPSASAWLITSITVGIISVTCPHKIRPVSIAWNHRAFAPYFRPSRSNRSLPPFRDTCGNGYTLLSPSISYCSG